MTPTGFESSVSVIIFTCETFHNGMGKNGSIKK